MGVINLSLKRMKHLLVEKLDFVRDKFYEKEKRNMWVVGVLYKALLDIYYFSVVSVYWANDGLVSMPSAIKFFASWVIYICGYYLIMQVDNKIMSLFLHVQWIVSITPVLVILAMQNDKNVVYSIFLLVLVFVQVFLCKRKKEYMAIGFCNGQLISYFTVMLCIVTAAVWFIMVIYNDFAGIKAFSFSYIYEMRSKLEYPPMFTYVVSWVTKAIIPWIFMIGFSKRNYLMIFYSLVSQVMFYMLMGYKGPLLVMVVVCGVCILSKLRFLISGIYIGIISVISLGTIGGFLETKSRVGSMITLNAIVGERTLFYPAMIKYQFYEFFAVYPKSYFADGMIGKLLSQTNLYRYRLGNVVYSFFNAGSMESQSNTGYLADSYAQMGFVGMILIGILVILFVRFVSNFTDVIPVEILCSIIACFVIMLNDGAFFTVMLTGGMWLIMVFLIIYANRGGKL